MPRMRHDFRQGSSMIGIVRHTFAGLSLLLFFLILLFWLSTGPTPRVIWWNHSDSLPRYHLTTIRDARFELGLYRGTSPGYWSYWRTGLTPRLEVPRQELPQQSKILYARVTRL